MSEPEWVTHAILWQVYPLGFLGAPISVEAQEAASGGGADGTHSLDRLVRWLDYAVELGVSGILLGPIFASETHGYDTVDYFRLDPRLAGPDDAADEGRGSSFDRLVTEAHARGLRVVLDGVFNHVGRGFEPFRRVVTEGRSAPEFGWFRAVGEPQGKSDAESEGGSQSRAETGNQPPQQRFENFEGHDALVRLNHDEPAVANFVARVMNTWLGRGADGWRLDAAYAVPTGFWARVLPQVRQEHPDALVFGEVIHGDYSAIVSESTLDSVTQYELWKAIWSSLSDANFWELSAALKRHNGFLEHFVPVTFVGNHDVNRLATAIADARHREHAMVVLMTTGGTPTIYYGDELGLAAAKEEREGGDDAIRPEFDAPGPGSLPASQWEVYHRQQNLIGLRRRHAWLHSARTTDITLTNEFFAYEVRARDGRSGEPGGGDRLIVLLNLSDKEGVQDVPGEYVVIAGEAALRKDGGARVPPHGWAVLAPA